MAAFPRLATTSLGIILPPDSRTAPLGRRYPSPQARFHAAEMRAKRARTAFADRPAGKPRELESRQFGVLVSSASAAVATSAGSNLRSA